MKKRLSITITIDLLQDLAKVYGLRAIDKLDVGAAREEKSVSVLVSNYLHPRSVADHIIRLIDDNSYGITFDVLDIKASSFEEDKTKITVYYREP